VDPDEVRAAWERAEGRADGVAEPLASGVESGTGGAPATLFGVPAAAGVDDLEGAAAVALGIPYAALDLDTIEGPAAVRRRSMPPQGWAPPSTSARLRETLERLAVVDAGDVAADDGDVEATFMRAHEKVADILAAGAVPIVFGGDHCVTLPVLQVLAGKLAGKLGIVTFDARLDLGFVPRYQAGSQWARVFELGIVEPANFIEIGIRDASARTVDHLVADELGIRVFTVADVDELGIVAVAQEALEAAATGTEALYVSIDLDVVEPCEGEPEQSAAAGLSVRELLRAVRTLAGGRVAGLDVCGLAPRRDPRGRLAALAAGAALEVLAGLAAQRP
jgi:agmatinase